LAHRHCFALNLVDEVQLARHLVTRHMMTRVHVEVFECDLVAGTHFDDGGVFDRIYLKK